MVGCWNEAKSQMIRDGFATFAIVFDRETLLGQPSFDGMTGGKFRKDSNGPQGSHSPYLEAGRERKYLQKIMFFRVSVSAPDINNDSCNRHWKRSSYSKDIRFPYSRRFDHRLLRMSAQTPIFLIYRWCGEEDLRAHVVPSNPTASTPALVGSVSISKWALHPKSSLSPVLLLHQWGVPSWL